MNFFLVALAHTNHVGRQIDTIPCGKEVGKIATAALNRFRIARQLRNIFQHRAEFIGREQSVVGDGMQRNITSAEVDENFREIVVVLHVFGALFPRHEIQRRLGDVKVATFDQVRHVTAEKCQQQGANVRSIDVGVGHDDDFVIADFLDVERAFHIAITDAGTNRGDHRLNLLVLQCAVEAGFFDVDQLTTQGQDGLRATISTLLGRATCGVTFDNIQLGF